MNKLYTHTDIFKYEIFDYLDLVTQIAVKSTCQKYYNIFRITNLSEYKYAKKVINRPDILDKIKYITIDNSMKHIFSIYDINNVETLKIITNGSYNGNNYYNNNNNDNNTNNNNCEQIYNTDIINCTKIKKLDIGWQNKNFKDINHLNQLEYLCAPKSNFNNKSFFKCQNIVELDIKGSQDITELNFLPNLTSLNISGTNILDSGISQCTKLICLNMTSTNNISDINNLVNLTYLNADISKLCDYGIKKCIKKS